MISVHRTARCRSRTPATGCPSARRAGSVESACWIGRGHFDADSVRATEQDTGRDLGAPAADPCSCRRLRRTSLTVATDRPRHDRHPGSARNRSMRDSTSGIARAASTRSRRPGASAADQAEKQQRGQSRRAVPTFAGVRVRVDNISGVAMPCSHDHSLKDLGGHHAYAQSVLGAARARAGSQSW